MTASLRRQRSLVLMAFAAIAALLLGVAPATSAEAPTRENVRHITTVPGTTGGHSFAYADRLYVGAYGMGMRIFDVRNPSDPVQIGEYIPGFQDAGDPGVRADAVPVATVMEGRHIAVLNGTSRTAGAQQAEFLDVTDPANPELLHRFSDAADGESHNGDIAHQRRLWLPSGGGQGLRIYDLDPLLDGEAPANLFRGNLATMWTESPHRGDKEVGGGFSHIHDLEIYEDHPVQVGTDAEGAPIIEPRDIVLAAEGGNYLGSGNTGSVFVVDITDPLEPVVLNRWRQELDDPSGHPIRYYHEVQFLDADPSVMIITDEDMHNGCDAGGVYAVRVSPDLKDATKLGDWFNGTGTPAAVCSAHVISTAGPYVFMGSYNAGLQVIDFSDPEQPTRAGQYIAEGANSWGALYHEGVVYVGDFGGRGLDVFEFVPDAVAQGQLLTPNPVISANELAGCDGSVPTVDGLLVEIPAAASDGEHTISAKGSGLQPYDLDIYFYDGGCGWMDAGDIAEADRDTAGPIPQGAAYAYVVNFLGGPTYTYAQISG